MNLCFGLSAETSAFIVDSLEAWSGYLPQAERQQIYSLQIKADSAPDAPRILRNSDPGAVRSAYRNRHFPESRYSYVGFRLALEAPEAADRRRR